MRCSIIIPLYNKAPYLDRLVESLAGQTLKPYEIIVIDDASTDGGLAVLGAALARHGEALAGVAVTVIPLPENRGVSHARNMGLNLAGGDWISLWDADDTYALEFLARMADVIEQHGPDLIVLGFTLVPSGERAPALRSIARWLVSLEPSLHQLADPLEVVTCRDFYLGPGSNALCRRDWLREVRYDEDCAFFEGIDFWYRALRGGLADGPTRVLLETGDYLWIHETPGSLCRRTLHHPDQAPLPGLLRRLQDSTDVYDRRLWQVIADRWLPNVVERLSSPLARIWFLWRNQGFLLRYYLRRWQS